MTRLDTLVQMAIEEAVKSEMLNRHGCVIAFKGRVVSRGYNSMHTQRGATKRCHSCHAEISALRRLRCKKRGLLMVLVQFNRCSELKNSLPCPDCARTINEFEGIKKLLFTVSHSHACLAHIPAGCGTGKSLVPRYAMMHDERSLIGSKVRSRVRSKAGRSEPASELDSRSEGRRSGFLRFRRV